MKLYKSAFPAAIFWALMGGNLHLAHAQENYVGVGLGQASHEEWCGIQTNTNGCDSADVGFKFFGGIQFSDKWALETGYANLGAKESRNGQVKMEMQSIFITAVRSIPLTDKFSLHGKLGVHRWEARYTVGSTSKGDDFSPFYAVGAEFKPNDRIGIRADYDVFYTPDVHRFGSANGDYKENATVNLPNVSVLLRF